MASSQVNKKNKRDTLRDMFDDSHADANPDDSAMDTRPDDPTLDPTSDAATSEAPTSDAVHAADLDGGDLSDLDDDIKDPDFDPSKEKEKEEDEDDVKVVKVVGLDPSLEQLQRANLKLQKSVKKIPGLHPDDKCRFEKYSAPVWNYFTRSLKYNEVKKKNVPQGTCKVVTSEVNGHQCGAVIGCPDANTTAMRNHIKAKHYAQHITMQAIDKSRLA